MEKHRRNGTHSPDTCPLPQHVCQKALSRFQQWRLLVSRLGALKREDHFEGRSGGREWISTLGGFAKIASTLTPVDKGLIIGALSNLMSHLLGFGQFY